MENRVAPFLTGWETAKYGLKWRLNLQRSTKALAKKLRASEQVLQGGGERRRPLFTVNKYKMDVMNAEMKFGDQEMKSLDRSREVE